MNSPLKWLVKGIFLFEGWRGAFFWQFKNIYLSHLNVWSCTAFLFWQSCNCCTIAYTQHKPDFMSCMWGGLHQVHTYSVCSAYAVHVWYASGAETAFTQESATDPWLFTTDTTCIYYFDFKSKHCYLKCFFGVVILFYTVQ